MLYRYLFEWAHWDELLFLVSFLSDRYQVFYTKYCLPTCRTAPSKLIWAKSDIPKSTMFLCQNHFIPIAKNWQKNSIYQENVIFDTKLFVSPNSKVQNWFKKQHDSTDRLKNIFVLKTSKAKQFSPNITKIAYFLGF